MPKSKSKMLKASRERKMISTGNGNLMDDCLIAIAKRQVNTFQVLKKITVNLKLYIWWKYLSRILII